MSTAYVIGAGVAGLATAKRLAGLGHKAVVFEATSHPGGRCRTLFDETLGLEIDNGTHLILSGNGAILEMADANELYISNRAEFSFVDLRNDARWKVDMGSGKIPWIHKGPPGASMWSLLQDYRKLNCDTSIGDVLDTHSPRWNSLWVPLIFAVMNTEPRDASARLMHSVLSQTLLSGGHYTRPVMAKNGLSKALIEPTANNIDIRYGQMLKGVETNGSHLTKLAFKGFEINLEDGDVVVSALPWGQAHEIFPSIPAPPRFNPIINVHFKTHTSVDTPEMTGLLGAVAHWLFRRKNVASVTISAAEEMVGIQSDEIARQVWGNISHLAGGGIMPGYRVIKEKSATFAATPQANAARPSTISSLDNLFLAGDWTATGLPATLEGAARSGFAAAKAVAGGAGAQSFNQSFN